jgi:hypothetical protein
MWGNRNTVKECLNASLNIIGGLTTTGVILNHSNINISQTATIQNISEPFNTYGQLISESNIDLNGATINNFGLLKSGTHCKWSNRAKIENACRVEVGTFCEFNGSDGNNDGKFIIASNRLSINSNLIFTNNGVVSTLNSNDVHLNINSGRAFTNNDIINVAGGFTINSTNVVFLTIARQLFRARPS